jgi:hypothetical protein
MATLTPFDQATLLTGITDPVLRGGICVALSDRWLAFMKESRLRTPQERLAALRAQAGSAMLYQEAYAWLRAAQGREEARTNLGRTVGHEYEHQTTIMRISVGMTGLRERMMADLDELGAAVTWTMVIPGWGRHAIAGFRGLVSIMNNMHKASLHIFDPNVGEYVGELEQLDGILRDLFRRVPEYQGIMELTRTTTR